MENPTSRSSFTNLLHTIGVDWVIPVGFAVMVDAAITVGMSIASNLRPRGIDLAISVAAVAQLVVLAMWESAVFQICAKRTSNQFRGTNASKVLGSAQ